MDKHQRELAATKQELSELQENNKWICVLQDCSRYVWPTTGRYFGQKVTQGIPKQTWVLQT